MFLERGSHTTPHGEHLISHSYENFLGHVNHFFLINLTFIVFIILI